MNIFGKNLNGWWQAFYLACIGGPLFNVGVKYAIDNYNSNPLIFLCMSGIVSSFVLLVYAGRGPLVRNTVRTLDTWLFGFLEMVSIAFGVSLMVYVTATQGSVLIRVASIFCFFITILMGQSTNKREVLFSLVALSGVGVMFYNLNIDTQEKAVALLLLLGTSLTQAFKQLLAEFHKTNIVAESRKDTMRVVGVVSGITSSVTIAILFILSFYKHHFALDGLKWIPEVKDFFNIYTFLCVCFFASASWSLFKYCEFYAAKVISAKYLSAVISILPLFALIYEMLFRYINGQTLDILTTIDYICIVLVVVGNMGIALSGVRFNANAREETELREKYNVATQEEVKHAIGNLRYGMRFFNNDIEQLAKTLHVKQPVIVDLLALDDDEEYSLSRRQYNLINKNFYLHIQTKDSLTGITNRGNLEQQIQDLMKEGKHFNLVFIDLNKFKAVNDDYGHDAGDHVLIETAKRMQKANPFGINARNGGDEFIMIVFEDLDQVTKILKDEFKKQITYNEDELKVGLSYGVAHYPEDAKSLDDLLKSADQQMYKFKQR